MLQGPCCPAGLWDRASQEPEGQVDVVDCAVDEDSAVAGGVLHEEAGVVAEVAGVGADHEGRSDGVLSEDFVVGVSVGGIEAAGEAGHYFEVGVGFGRVDDGLRLLLLACANKSQQMRSSIPLQDWCSTASRKEHVHPSQSLPKIGSHGHQCWLRSKLPGGLGEKASHYNRYKLQCQTPCILRFPLPRRFRGELCCTRPQPALGECGTAGCERGACPVRIIRQG